MVAAKCCFISLVAIVFALLILQMIMLLLSVDHIEMNSRSFDSRHKHPSVLTLFIRLVVEYSGLKGSVFNIPLGDAYYGRKSLGLVGDRQHAFKLLHSILTKKLYVIAINYNFSIFNSDNARVIAARWDGILPDVQDASTLDSKYRNFSSSTVIIYQSCDPLEKFHLNIYEYYDSIIRCGKSLSVAFPDQIIAWEGPLMWSFHRSSISSVIDSRKEDLNELHTFLIDTYVKTSGIVVVTAADFDTIEMERGYDHISPQYREHLYNRLVDKLINEMLSVSPTSDFRFCAGELDCTDWYPSQLKKIQTSQVHRMSHPTKNNISSMCSKYLLTRKFHPHCHPSISNVRAVLVTGLGGSGTHFIANRLRSLGWRLYHEGIDDDGAVSWFYSANDRMLGTTYPFGSLTDSRVSALRPRFELVVHVVRDPLSQIASFTAHTNKTYDFVLLAMKHISESTTANQFAKLREAQRHCHRGDRCHLHFAALTWLHWNRFVRMYADVTFRLDQFEELQHFLCHVYRTKGSALSSSSRMCPIQSCSSVMRGKDHSQQRHYSWLYPAWLCTTSERTFRTSKNNKVHLKYNWSDISDLDAQLGEEIRSDAIHYGFEDHK